MKRVIVAARKPKRNYVQELNAMPLGQVIRVGYYGDLYVKLETSLSGRKSDVKSYFFAIDKDGDFVDSSNMKSRSHYGRIYTQGISSIAEIIETYPDKFEVCEILDPADMIKEMRDVRKNPGL